MTSRDSAKTKRMTWTTWTARTPRARGTTGTGSLPRQPAVVSPRAFLARCGRWLALAGGLGWHAALARRSHAASWSHHGETGPEAWGTLQPEYAACAAGTSQSPVDLADARPGAGPGRLAFDYRASRLRLTHSGHDVRADYDPGSRILLDGEPYELIQFHFHTPSEHTVSGRSYPLEAHFVHQSAAGRLAVVGLLFEAGRPSPFLEQFWDLLPSPHTSNVSERSIRAADALPARRGYYRYEGSLTTPPCSEPVDWIVLREPVEASDEQIARYAALVGPNARPVQPLGARAVYTYEPMEDD